MRVCLLNDSFPPVIDGVANVVMNYAKILQTQNLAKVAVGTPRYPGVSYGGYPYRVIPYSSFNTTMIVDGYRAGNPFDLKEIRDMADFEPDIIHTHCPVVSTYVARSLRAKTDVPVVFTYHTKFDEDIARAVKAEFLRKESMRVLAANIEACDEVWVVSQGAGENMRALGYTGDYRVVSNGVDFPRGRASEDAVREATKGYDLPEGVPMYLFVGRIIDYKGIPYILEAMAKLSAAGQDYRMVFVGSGPDEDKLKEMGRELGVLDNPDPNHVGKCIFTGPIRDREVLRAWNTRADVFVFPSTFDTNGIVVREAAACGLASVLIEGSCAAEGITDDRNGFLTRQDSESIAQLLIRISQDLEHVHQVGQHAMDEIYISWEESVHAAHERYGEIIELKQSGRLELKTKPLAEFFLNMPDEIEEDLQNLRKMQAQMFDGMKENAEEWSDQVQAGVTTAVTDMRSGAKSFREGLKEEMQGLREEMRSDAQEWKSGLAEIKEELKEIRDKGFKEGVRELKEEIHETIEESIVEVKEAIGDVKESLGESWEEVKETVDEVKDSWKGDQ